MELARTTVKINLKVKVITNKKVSKRLNVRKVRIFSKLQNLCQMSQNAQNLLKEASKNLVNIGQAPRPPWRPFP